LGTAFTPQADPSADPEKIPLILSLCEKCRHVQVLDVVDPNLMFKAYPHTGLATPGTAKHLEAIAQEAAQRSHLQKGDLVVDIGAGNGTLLDVFKKMGMKTIAVDPSAQAQVCAKNLGIPIYSELFSPGLANTIMAKHGAASLVTSSYTLGSVDNLHAVMAGVRYLLKPNGLFYVEEPYLPEILAHNLFDALNHERLSFFTITALQPFLQATMMHLVEATHIKDGGGALRVILQRSDGHHVASASINDLVETERKRLGPTAVEAFNQFAVRVEDLKTKIKSMTDDLKRQGKKIAGYGASSRTVTFVHECGWDHTVLDYIIDDDNGKHGTHVPGTRIPVVSAAALKENRPDAVILFAYHDASFIMDRHADYQKSGGRFIRPFPMPRFA
jgi:2-polyprenyl-3-methyl-5-hydroxy-6-metoxy-1,4-benzoquinol methylase